MVDFVTEVLSLYIYNVHCKQIVFGASADNGYASFLSSFFVDMDVSSRVRLIKGPPFAFEFQNILPRFKCTEFKNVFRSALIANDSMRQHDSRKSQDLEPLRAQVLFPINGSSYIPWRSKDSGELNEIYGVMDEKTVLSFKQKTAAFKPEQSPADQDSDQSSTNTPAELQYDPLVATTAAPLSSLIPTIANRMPTESEVEAVLISSTNQKLLLSPAALDFGVVKAMAAQRLGLELNFWGRSDQDEWHVKSKKIIKAAVVSFLSYDFWVFTDVINFQEDWVERTDNPPPKNATWMLHHFPPGQSPSSVMRSFSARSWRTKKETLSSMDTSPSTEPHRYSFVFQNSKGQRVDVPQELDVSLGLINELRNRKPRLCNTFYLKGSCNMEACPYDHTTALSNRELEALMCLSRSVRCPQGSACADTKCTKGHMCANGRKCKHGNDCRFADFHGMDTEVATQL